VNAPPGAEPIAEREVVVSHVIDAPRDVVFEAYTTVEHLSRWYGPDGFTTTTTVFEFRPYGIWAFTMHAPDGTDFANWIRWLEIVPPERIVYRHGASADDPEAFMSTVTFVDRGPKSEVILRALFNTKAQRDRVVEEYRAVEAGHQTLGRLAAYVTNPANAKGEDER
jgi:uncharacterized protein YndB with AHSA1/START domain